MDNVLRLFIKKGFSLSHSNPNKPFFEAGEEVRIGKISESLSKVMLICTKDDRHAWMDLKDYNEYIEDKLV